MKIRKLLVTMFITLILPIRIVGEGIVVFNYVYAEENNNDVYIQNENTTSEEPKEVTEEPKEELDNETDTECEEETCNKEETTEEIIEETTEETPEINNEKDTSANISYSTHVQDIGWQREFTNGEIAGTSGKALRLEAIKIKLDSSLEGNIEYETHVENIGWQGYKKDGEISGTTGKRLRIEAIRIKLTGEIAEYYDIYYRVHIENHGWLGWAKNGSNAGSQAMALRLEAMEIKLLPKEDTSITIQNDSFLYKTSSVSYQAHVQNIGNQKIVGENKIAGTTGKGLKLEALKVYLNTNTAGNIEYQSFVEGKGWEETSKTSGIQTGTTGQFKAIQLIKMNLTGDIANDYEIYYRVHSEAYGWLDWAKNGEIAGVNHYSIEAIQIRLYLKADKTRYNLPTNRHYIEKVSYRPVHYLQKDSRWNKKMYGNYRFGMTGCAPTSMAMAFTGITGRVILPNEVGNYLYYNTNEFNKKTQGSSGQAIILAAKHYNIKLTPLEDKEQIIEALENGKIVYAAMGNGKYGKPTYNHAIIFYGYNNNRTTVYDPLIQYDIPESVDLLWNEQSKDPDDYSGGSNFYSLERY